MKYWDLLKVLSEMTEEQLDYDVTVEVANDWSNLTEIYPAELKICSDDHSFYVNGHPVFFIEV